MDSANILVCGKTGVGKTGLIQSVTAPGTVPDSAISDSHAQTRGFDCYSAGPTTYVDSEGYEPGQRMEDFVAKIKGELDRRLDTGIAGNLIHAIWYCVDGTNARLQDMDMKFLSSFPEKALLVVTKSEDMRKEQFERFERALAEVVDERRTVFVSGRKKTGIDRLLQMTREVTSASLANAGKEIAEYENEWQAYYSSIIADSKRQCSEEADHFINWAASRAAAATIGLGQVVGAPIMMANEIYMIHKIGSVYGYSVDRKIVTKILSVGGTSSFGKRLISFLQGTTGVVATTYGIGKAAKAYFESGMTFNADELKRQFLESRKKGEKIDWGER